jgi:hypothetical protein
MEPRAGQDPGEPIDERTVGIRSDIESTRAELKETVDAIQDRLRPRNMVSRAAESVREVAVDKVRHLTGGARDDVPRRAADWYYGDGVTARIRENPLPAAIAAVSLAWLAFGRRPSRDYAGPPSYGGNTDRPPYWGDRRPEEYGYVSQSAEGSNDYLGEAPHAGQRVQTALQHAGERTRRASSRAGTGIEQFAHENTLIAGLIAAGIGGLVALALPTTRRENEIMGDARDAVVDQAKETARGVADQVQQTAREVQRVATEVIADTTNRTSGASGADNP